MRESGDARPAQQDRRRHHRRGAAALFRNTKRRIGDSATARLCIGEPERVAYGRTEIERLDIYRTGLAAAPVFVFIHGGAWRSGRSKDFAIQAEMFLAAGAHFAVPDFAWVQDAGGSLM